MLSTGKAVLEFAGGSIKFVSNVATGVSGSAIYVYSYVERKSTSAAEENRVAEIIFSKVNSVEFSNHGKSPIYLYSYISHSNNSFTAKEDTATSNMYLAFSQIVSGSYGSCMIEAKVEKNKGYGLLAQPYVRHYSDILGNNLVWSIGGDIDTIKNLIPIVITD